MLLFPFFACTWPCSRCWLRVNFFHVHLVVYTDTCSILPRYFRPLYLDDGTFHLLFASQPFRLYLMLRFHFQAFTCIFIHIFLARSNFFHMHLQLSEVKWLAEGSRSHPESAAVSRSQPKSCGVSRVSRSQPSQPEPGGISRSQSQWAGVRRSQSLSCSQPQSVHPPSRHPDLEHLFLHDKWVQQCTSTALLGAKLFTNSEQVGWNMSKVNIYGPGIYKILKSNKSAHMEPCTSWNKTVCSRQAPNALPHVEWTCFVFASDESEQIPPCLPRLLPFSLPSHSKLLLAQFPFTFPSSFWVAVGCVVYHASASVLSPFPLWLMSRVATTGQTIASANQPRWQNAWLHYLKGCHRVPTFFG